MLALYRKYRPKSLEDVVGESQVTEPLKNALNSGKVSHSYLFTGPRGCGKTSVARILAHEVNGFDYELEDSYLDIIEIDAASNTGVDNIRDLREKALIAPSEGKYKVYIIDEVHMLSKSAFNALLKTLEEPPEHVIFILATTDLEKVPVTITSRSQVFHFRLADPGTMFAHLKKICNAEKINISDAALRLVISRGGGSFRDSLSVLDQIASIGGKSEISETRVAELLGLPLDSSVLELLNAFSVSDAEKITSLLKELLSEGLKAESVAEALIKKIVSSPTSETLPLLEKLPSVSAPFPEAKLLLALLSFTAYANSSKDAPKTKNPIPKLSEIPQEKSQQENPTPEPKKPVPSVELSSLSPAIAQQLKKCKILEDDELIHIYPTRKITQTILSRPANMEILKGYFPKNFVVHELEDLEKSPEIAQISDIMGNIEEVQESDGVPF